MEYQWQATRAFGDAAATEVANALTRHGHQVVDISQLKDSQRRGIDLLVDGDYVDVKSDRYAPVNFFFEDECNGQPGCFWKSRADAWYYWFPNSRKLYLIDLPKAQRFVALSLDEYTVKLIASRNGASSWSATGRLVPVEHLLATGIAVDRSVMMNEDTP